MSTCAFCGAELPDNARFCSNCGKTPQASQALQVPQVPQSQQPSQVAPAVPQVANMKVSPMQSIPPPLSQQSSDHAEQQQAVLSDMSQSGVPPNAQAPSSNGPVKQGTPPIGRTSKWLAGTSPKWLIIGLVIIIIVASGLGVTAAVVRAHLTGTANSTTTPGCTNPPNATCTPAQKSKTPTRSGRIANLLLSGAVNGRLTSAKITRCGRAGLPYDVFVQGKVGGTSYSLVFRITAYHGAGTYSVGQILANFSQQPVSATATWATTGTQPTTATVSSTTRAGTMNITLTGANNSIHITGSWSCG